jgi:hypothetical protein
MTQIARGTIPVIGQGFHDQRNAVGTVTLIGNRLIFAGIIVSGGLFDNSLNIVVGHVIRFRLSNTISEL